MNRTLIALLVLTLAPVALSATTITGDITANTTWNAAGSPYVLNPAGASGGTITVRNGATLTIDTSSGAVAVQWNEDCDFKIGNGSTEQGTLEIKAASGALTFQIKTGGNVRIANNGRMYWSNTTAATTFTRYDGSNTWGALIFEASQTRQSEVKKSTFSYGGNDSKTAMILVEDNEDYPPYLENLTFSNQATSGVAAVRMNTKGINTLKEGNVVMPFSVSSVDYVFYINAVTSTAETIRFPDIDSPDTPTNYLAGTCTVGDSSNVSHWRFEDGYTFKCAASSVVDVVHGSLRGSTESRPVFQSVSGTPGYNDWTGIRDNGATNENVFDGIGPIAFVEVWHASSVNISKFSASFAGTEWRIPGLIVKHCYFGLRASSQAGVVIFEQCVVGGSVSTDRCYANALWSTNGATYLYDSTLWGLATNSPLAVWTGSSYGSDAHIRGCRLIGPGNMGLNFTSVSSGTAGSALVERTVIEGSLNIGVQVLQLSTYAPDRSLVMRHCSIYGATEGVLLDIDSTSATTVSIEDCTLADGGTYGFRGLEARAANSSVRLLHTTIYGWTYGAYFNSGTNNTCEYVCEECYFTANSYGIYDARTQTARAVATLCTFQGNTTYGAYDASGGGATTDMMAENCYWGAANGPSGSGPGSGDAVNANVDYDPWLGASYIGWLIGGSPAGPADLGVANATGAPILPDQLHIIDDDSIAVSWTFASDFEGLTQGAYEIEIDDDPAFGSLLYNGSKTSSSSSDIGITPTLAAGTFYYLRIKLWNSNDEAGPWYYHTFRTNTAPPQVSNTNRSPANSASLTDWTPVFQWEIPADAEEDSLHFEVYLERFVFPDTTSFTMRSWKASTSFPIFLGVSYDVRSNFEVSMDGGVTWLPMPADGAPKGASRVRFTMPNDLALADTGGNNWTWYVKAWDGFEYSASASTTWSFSLARSYTLSGTLNNTSGTGQSGKTIRIYHGTTLLGQSVTTDVVGYYEFSGGNKLTAALKVGDILTVFVDGDGEDAARLVQFTGDNIALVHLVFGRAIIAPTLDGDPITNADFAADSGDDADIPWTLSGSNLTFASTLNDSNKGVWIEGQWDMSGDADGTTSLDTELHIEAGGLLRTQGNDASFHSLSNEGRLEILDGSRLTLDGANSTSSGTLVIRDGKLRMKKAGGLSLTIDNGVCEFVRTELDVDTGDASSLIVDSASNELALFSCADSSFSKVGLVVEADGVVSLFNGNTFKDGISTRHIYWKTEDARSTNVMRGNQFDYGLTQGSQFNVEPTANAIPLTMIGCGGIRWGEGYDKNGGSEGDSLDDVVLWELTPPTDLKVFVGDARLRLEWTASDQAELANAGYNVYRSTSPGGGFSQINGSLVTNTYYNDESLTNGTTYYYYVTTIDTNPTPDAESGGSNRVGATPAASDIDEISPTSTPATSILALTVIGEATHWEGSTSVNIEQNDGGGSSGVTVNDTLVISASLILVDVTLASASAEAWDVDVTENDVWGIGAYDEVETATLTVTANEADESDRPTLVFSTNNGGIADSANTSGAFTLNIDFTDQGNGIDTSGLEIFASRDVTISSSNVTAGTELIGAGLSIDTLNDTRATFTINQTAGTELFANGEYTVYARVQDDSGNSSEWAARKFYVEGANADVIKCTSIIVQGVNHSITLTGSGLSSTQAIDFGSDIVVNWATGSGSSIGVNVTVGQLAAAGPRVVTTNNGVKAGIVVVDWPTNILPTITNAEPSRNPAIAGVNVFLKNGAFFKSETDIATRGRMMGMSWSRFYRSDITHNGPLGNKWVGHYFQRVEFSDKSGGTVHWYTPDGRRETAIIGASSGVGYFGVGVYVRAERETTHNTITLTDRHGYSCVFNKDGRLWKCIDRNGNATVCTYNNLGQLVTITDDRGKTWEIEYYDHGRVQKVIDKVWDTSTPREVEYVYDSNGDLVEQKAPTTARYDGTPLPRITYGYAYDSAHRLTKCINPREFAESANPIPYLENFYDSTGRVVDQKLGDEADVIDHHITKSAFIRLRYESSTLIRELDRNGLRTDYTIDASGRTTDVKRYTAFWSVDTDYPITHSTVSSILAKLRSTDPTYFQTVFTYNSSHEVLTITYPRGNKVTYAYPSGSSQAAATADSCSGAILTDSSESWTTNAFAGMTLRMGTSASNYRYYPIASNTGTTITVGTGFDLQADGWNASAYAVYSQSNDPLAAGNVLTVTRSDEGLGSLSDLVTTYTYEPRYQFVKTAKNPRNYTTTYTYDYEESAANGADAGNLVKVESPTITGSMASSGTITTRTTYNEYGQPMTSINGEGYVTRFIYYPSGDTIGFLKQRITDWGNLNLTSEYDYNKAGDMTASWPPRAFEAGVTKDDFKFSAEVNELGQTWHTTRKLEVGISGALTLVSVDTYHYFDANGNRTNSFSEYITDGATAPSGPSDVLDPTTFPKASSAMAATWRESSATYNLLNYTATSTQDAIAGSAITQYTTRVEYDSNYNTLASITPLGNRTHTIYDERDMVYRRIPGAESDVQATFEVDYDTNGNTLKSRDALGNETVNVYDGFDRLTKTTDPASHYREFDYDANSNTTETRAFDSLGVLLAKGQTTFDEIDRAYISKRLANDHLGVPIGDGWATNTTVFDKNSRVVSSTNDNGVTFYSFYDGADRTLYTRDAVGNEAHFEYNANGATKKVTYREINGLDNSVEVSHIENVLNKQDGVVEYRDRRYTSGTFDTSVERKYDGWNRVTVSYDAVGNTVTTNYDLLSRVTDRTEENGTDDIQTMFGYDDDSRVRTRAIKKNPGGSDWQETTYEYDERSRLITKRLPDASLASATGGEGIWTYSYDANSNLIGWQDPLGNKITNTYESRNLIAYRTIIPSGTTMGSSYESYEFDGLGRLESCSNYEGTRLMVASHWYYNTLSMPERYDQTVGSFFTEEVVDTWTMRAEYDATGFRTATVFWDDRRVEHTPDQLNRLLESYDVTENMHIATYIYAGAGRIVERTNGNGTRTNYTWEDSGCGCGGSTAFVERIENRRLEDDTVLFANDRRYNRLGQVTVERRDHFGETGDVYRYDLAHRLTNVYFGVDLTGSNLTDFADSETPDNPGTGEFSLKRTFNLDPRGNRTGSTGIRDTDTNGGTVKDTDYDVDEWVNLYTAIDSQSFTYDANKQQTRDITTGDYVAYDYRGLMVAKDDDAPSSPLSTPHTVMTHDCMGRLCLTEHAVDDGIGGVIPLCTDASIFDVCETCGSCNANGNPPVGQDKKAPGASPATEQHTVVQRTFGAEDFVSRSAGGVSNVYTAVRTPSGSQEGSSIVYERWEYITPDPLVKHVFQNRGMLGSLEMTADENGDRLDMWTYDQNGAPFRFEVYAEFRDADIQSSTHDSPSSGQTTIELIADMLIVDELKDKLVYISVPGDANDRLRMGFVISNDSDSIIITDAGTYDIDAALDNGSCLLVLDAHRDRTTTGEGIWTANAEGSHGEYTFTHESHGFDNTILGQWLWPDPNYQAWYLITGVDTDTITVSGEVPNLEVEGLPYVIAPRPYIAQTLTGQWTSAPANTGGASGTTKFTCSTATFQSFMVGWQMIVNLEEPVLMTISEYVSSTEIRVKGDADAVAASGDFFLLSPPPGVNPQTGTLASIEGEDVTWHAWTSSGPSQFLWAQYKYMPPMLGFTDWNDSGNTVGAQTGANKLGQYHCNNRVYDINTGRWTSPDPAASPWANLFDYASCSPLFRVDPSGLDLTIKGYTGIDKGQKADLNEEAILAALKEICGSADLRIEDGKVVSKDFNFCNESLVLGKVNPGGGDCSAPSWTRAGYKDEKDQPIGCKLLCLIIGSRFTVEIDASGGDGGNYVRPKDTSGIGSIANKGPYKKANPTGGGSGPEGKELPIDKSGEGTGAVVKLGKATGDYVGAPAGGKRRLSRILAHELAHALHCIEGTFMIAGTGEGAQPGNWDCPGWTNYEEKHAIEDWENKIADEIRRKKKLRAGHEDWQPATGH